MHAASWGGNRLRLNLGCNDDLRHGYTNVDVCEPCDFVADLSKPWPWVNSSVGEILANDVLEHLPSKIHTMNEAHRVLYPGGLLILAVPCVYLADGRVNPGAFADPTHKSLWTLDDRYYWGEEWNNPQGERGRFGKQYGITALFKIIKWGLAEYGLPHERRSKISGILEAVK